jgi:hypothetical protein
MQAPGAAGQIAIGLRGVGGGLLVAHADISDAFLLRGRGEQADRKPYDPDTDLVPSSAKLRGSSPWGAGLPI